MKYLVFVVVLVFVVSIFASVCVNFNAENSVVEEESIAENAEKKLVDVNVLVEKTEAEEKVKREEETSKVQLEEREIKEIEEDVAVKAQAELPEEKKIEEIEEDVAVKPQAELPEEKKIKEVEEDVAVKAQVELPEEKKIKKAEEDVAVKPQVKLEDTKKHEDIPAADPNANSPQKKSSSNTDDASNYGRFRLTNKPVCEVFINGKSYGLTPVQVKLPAGSYQIHFVNAEEGIDSIQTEILKPGEVKKVSRK